MIDKLTQKQEKELVEFRNEWLKIGLTEGEADIEAIRDDINAEYREIGEKPPYIWRCESPMTAQLIINLLKKNLDSNLWSNLGLNLESNLELNLGSNLESNLGSNLRSNLWSNLRSNLESNLRSNLEPNYISTSLWGSLDSYWIAWYLFPHLYIRKMHTRKQMERLNRYANIAKNAFWWYPFKGVCFVCDRPNFISKDAEGRLHQPDRSAISFSDGYGVFVWHGLNVNKKIIDKEITKEDVQKEKNAEIRRAMMEVLEDKFFGLLDVEIVDEDDTHSKKVTLYRTKQKDDLTNEYIQYVKVICHSTNREYMLCVPPDVKNAWEAVAWTFDKSKGEYKPIIET